MVPICESLTRSAAACSQNSFQFDMNPDVTHDVYIFHHILLFIEAHTKVNSHSSCQEWLRSIRAGS